MGNNNQRNSQRGRSASPVPSKKNSALVDIPKSSLSPAPRKSSAKKSKLSMDAHPENLLGGVESKFPPGNGNKDLLKTPKLDPEAIYTRNVRDINSTIQFGQILNLVKTVEQLEINGCDSVLMGFNTAGVTDRYPIQGSAVARRISFSGSLNDFVDGYAGTIERFDEFVKRINTYEIATSPQFKPDRNLQKKSSMKHSPSRTMSRNLDQVLVPKNDFEIDIENMNQGGYTNSNLMRKLSKKLDKRDSRIENSQLSQTNFLDGEDNRMFTRNGKIHGQQEIYFEKQVSGNFGGVHGPSQVVVSQTEINNPVEPKNGRDTSNLSMTESEQNRSTKVPKKNLNQQLDLAGTGTFTENHGPKKNTPVISLTPRAEPGNGQFIIFNTESKTPKVEPFTGTASFKGRKQNSNLQPAGKRTMTVIFDVKQQEKAEKNGQNNSNNSFLTVNDVSKGPVVNKKFGKNTQPNNVSRVPQKTFWREAERPSTNPKKSSVKNEPKSHEQAKIEESVSLLQKNLDTHKYEKNLTQNSPSRKYFQGGPAKIFTDNPIEESEKEQQASPDKRTPAQKRYSHPEDLPVTTNHTNTKSVSQKSPSSVPKQFYEHDKVVGVRSDDEGEDSDEPIEAKIDLSAYLTGSSHQVDEGQQSSGKASNHDDIKTKTFNKYHNESLKYMKEGGSLVENQPYYEPDNRRPPTNPRTKNSHPDDYEVPLKKYSAPQTIGERVHQDKSRKDPFDNFDYHDHEGLYKNYQEENDDDAMLEDIRSKLSILNQKVDINSLKKGRARDDEVNYGSAKTPKTKSHIDHHQNNGGTYTNKPVALQRDSNEYDEGLRYFNNGKRQDNFLPHHIPMTTSEYVNRIDSRADNLATDQREYGSHVKSPRPVVHNDNY